MSGLEQPVASVCLPRGAGAASIEDGRIAPPSGKVTLILTNSYDLAANRLVRRLGNDRVFRLNVDLWRDYRIELRHGDFLIENPTGRSVRRRDIAKLFWRKPISRFKLQGHSASAYRSWGQRAVDVLWRRRSRNRPTPTDYYLEEEVFYAIREIKNLLWQDGRVVLIEPAAYMRLGKFVQMERASSFFDVPSYEFALNRTREERARRRRVVKSLTSERIGDDGFFWTTEVDENALDDRGPWLVQDVVEARLDVTVVYVRGRAFAFALDRTSFTDKTLDWREVGEQTTPLWVPHTLPEAVLKQTLAYMQHIALDYGRLDFLFDGERYWFLEVNANGEWDWLDPNGTGGVLDAISAELDPDSTVHAIPTCQTALC